MTRLATGGSELNDQIGIGPDGGRLTTGTGSVAVNSLARYAGGSSALCQSGASGGTACYITTTSQVQNVNSSPKYAIRAYVYVTAYPDNTTPILTTKGWASTRGDLEGGVAMGSDGTLYAAAYNLAGATWSFTASSYQMPLNQWHRIEACLSGTQVASTSHKFDTTGIAVDGTDLGVSQTGFTNSATSSGGFVFCAAGFFSGTTDTPSAGNNKTIYVDDLAWDTVIVASPPTYIGEGAVGYLFPVSDNNRGAWTGGAGGTTSLFDALNNDPPVGKAAASETNTTQIKYGASGASSCDINMGAYSDPRASGGLAIPPLSTISYVTLFTITGSEGTSVDAGSQLIVSNPTQGAADTITDLGTGAAVGTYSTNWKLNAGTIQASPSVTLSTKPVCRISKTQSQARVADCCQMILQVEWVEVRDPGQPALHEVGSYNQPYPHAQAVTRAATI